ncbi:MAG: YggT family protein [Gammaproteobacteria bacterium]|nr:MAG: YggT family protein [Gammaproteobacteria bacterium]
MNNALLFLVKTLLDLYILSFLLRLLLQWVRADFYNPLSQFIVRVTNPLVRPLRRVVPPLGGLDTATLLVILGLELAATALLLGLATGGGPLPGLATLLYLAVLRTVVLVLRLYFVAILISVILSWVGRDSRHPLVALLNSVVEPVLRPVRRILPSIGGLDLSPLIVLLLIQALLIAIPLGGVLY